MSIPTCCWPTTSLDAGLDAVSHGNNDVGVTLAGVAGTDSLCGRGLREIGDDFEMIRRWCRCQIRHPDLVKQVARVSLGPDSAWRVNLDGDGDPVGVIVLIRK